MLLRVHRLFLSTPSARRATCAACASICRRGNFYPRPPRGGRHVTRSSSSSSIGISIHALREEGDSSTSKVARPERNFYPRPPRGGRRVVAPAHAQPLAISIHALREEGDEAGQRRRGHPKNFYPRPPRGGRRLGAGGPLLRMVISIHALREEGDGALCAVLPAAIQFLSTPSARRATAKTEKNISAFVSL